jgi:putative flippase GtrA
MDKIKNLFKKYREIIMYIIFGVLTTVISLATYFIILYVARSAFAIAEDTSQYNIARTIAQVMQWITGVTFAFFTNKKWVFCNKDKDKNSMIKQMSTFAASRLLTFGLDTLIVFVTIFVLTKSEYRDFTLLGIVISKDVIAKTLSSVVVIVSNYVLSKLIVFRKKTVINTK